MDVKQGELVLCEFYFSDLGQSKRRPVIVFRDNLPFNDFVGIPVSSKIGRLHADESLLEREDLADGTLPKTSKAMVRKTFVIAKSVVSKKYGALSSARFQKLHSDFCEYFGCCDESGVC
ncbi:type II toxin-antitoxin system PemK/MazF family toxin [Marinobacter sp.]|uniref:type II toxin-antitoxin system PemK/MazF family toxin n=1 Tax=Marinobacter sp. TaxID=50741 RepID=UPI0019E86657|nr:type II toxin-antitoxin system PemK/MazF family toxin [Marinobacter sp.]MBE0487144.1 type II toxin-antitoxin system PemK/MazF family toxin [Marinobacter sp.]